MPCGANCSIDGGAQARVAPVAHVVEFSDRKQYFDAAAAGLVRGNAAGEPAARVRHLTDQQPVPRRDRDDVFGIAEVADGFDAVRRVAAEHRRNGRRARGRTQRQHDREGANHAAHSSAVQTSRSQASGFFGAAFGFASTWARNASKCGRACCSNSDTTPGRPRLSGLAMPQQMFGEQRERAGPAVVVFVARLDGFERALPERHARRAVLAGERHRYRRLVTGFAVVQPRVREHQSFERNQLAYHSELHVLGAFGRRHADPPAAAFTRVHFACDHREAFGAEPMAHVLRLRPRRVHGLNRCVQYDRRRQNPIGISGHSFRSHRV